MKSRTIVRGSAAALTLGAAGFGAWILSLPPAVAGAGPPPIDAAEVEAILEALKPPKRKRPVITVIGINDATEGTDYLMPTGILRRADVADVLLLAMSPGPVKLYPALTVHADATVTEFDARYPEGADYVIVPAMSRDDDPDALQWIRSQAAKGATVIGVCAGAKVVGAAGLLAGRRATTHWYYLRELRRNNPTAIYVPNRRLVVDPPVATTTGITGAMPMALTLIEAIGGRTRAEAVARELGVTQWDVSHNSAPFRLTRPFALSVLANVVGHWRREDLGLELVPGIDEVSLALVSDAWSRTYRSRAVTFATAAGPVESRSGVRIVPEQVTTSSRPADGLVPPAVQRKPAEALDAALAAIAQRYGTHTARVVAMQLEYPSPQLQE